MLQRRVGSPSVSGSGQMDVDEDEVIKDQDKLDAETNTNSSEPTILTCSVCKQQLTSAWSLMQHVQVWWLFLDQDLWIIKILLQLQHGLLLTSDQQQRNNNLMLAQKEHFLKMQLPGHVPPHPMMPPNFQNQFPGHFAFRGFHGKFAGRLPSARFHPGLTPPPRFPLQHPGHNISLRYSYLKKYFF